ncbi:MAG: pantoate--beta-alanine ligase [Elusimicrobia bacterium]|nr:pantoate--beta-alanine ligase [Elusimicrobiota bacterium]
MKIIKSPQELQKACLNLIKKNKSIGLVPTMGALHAGHISLIKKSVSQNDITVVSVYVNPIQFGPNEDYNKYPRPIENDIKICKDNKVDFLFLPTNETLYGKDFLTYVSTEKISKIMCGVTRPIHFRGVTTVVSKLLNISLADRAYFGLKDYQQYIIIKKMVEDLNIRTKIIGCPIVREKSGIALSSRNTYLKPEAKAEANGIYAALCIAKKEFSAGKNLSAIKKNLEKNILKIKDSKIDYIELRNADTLEPADKNDKKVLAAVAVKVGNVRLIDNIVCSK